MPSWRSVRPGRQYLNLTNLGKRVIKDTLIEVSEGAYQGKPQIVALLQREELAIAINSTSCQALAKAFGDDYEGWNGKKVIIKAGQVKFGNGQASAIIIAPDKGGKS